MSYDKSRPHFRVGVSSHVTPARVREVVAQLGSASWYLEDHHAVVLEDRTDAFRCSMCIGSELPQLVGLPALVPQPDQIGEVPRIASRRIAEGIVPDVVPSPDLGSWWARQGLNL